MLLVGCEKVGLDSLRTIEIEVEKHVEELLALFSVDRQGEVLLLTEALLQDGVLIIRLRTGVYLLCAISLPTYRLSCENLRNRWGIFCA